MSGVDQFVGDIQPDGEGAGLGKVAPPPVVAGGSEFDSFNNDQPVGVGGEYGVSSLFRRQAPVGCQIAVSPCGRAVRFVVQVGADHGRVVGIAGCQQFPV